MKLKRKTKRQAIQFGEYWVGGNVFFLSAYATFSLLFGVLHMDWWLAKLIGDTVGWTLNYMVQRYWAFPGKGLKKHEGRNRFRYIALAVVDTILGYAIVGGLDWLGVSPFIGVLASAFFFTFWNYFWNRFWVFR